MTTNICLYSDLHHEFGKPDIKIPDEAEIVVLAGDIDTRLLINFQILVREHPTKVFLYVPGNHDFYGRDYQTQLDYIHSIGGMYENLHILHNSEFKYKDITFYGSTLWTDFTAYGPVSEVWCKMNIKGMIGDFWQIGYGGDKINPTKMAELNQQAKKGISDFLQSTEGKKVVVTHFPPLTCCKHGQIEENELSAYFTNNLTYLFHKEYSPNYWLYGHNHWSDSMEVGKTKLLSNQHGYPGENNSRYYPSGCMFKL